MDSFNALPQGWDEDGFYVDLDDVPRKVYDTYETDIIIKRLKEENEWWKELVRSHMKADPAKADVIEEIIEDYEEMMQQVLES